MRTEADRQSIEDVAARLLEGVNSGDVGRVLSVWASDGVLMPPNHAAIHGRAAIETYFRQLFQRAKFKFVFTESATSIDEHTAIQRVSYTADVWPSGSATAVADRGKGLHVYRREKDGAWKLATDIWNSDIPRQA